MTTNVPFTVDPSLETNLWESVNASSFITTILSPIKGEKSEDALKLAYTRQIRLIQTEELPANPPVVRDSTPLYLRHFFRDLSDFIILLKYRVKLPLSLFQLIVQRYNTLRRNHVGVLTNRKNDFARAPFHISGSNEDNVLAQCIIRDRMDILEWLLDECEITLSFRYPSTNTFVNLFAIAVEQGSLSALRCFDKLDLLAIFSKDVSKNVKNLLESLFLKGIRNQKHLHSVLSCFDYLFDVLGWNLRDDEESAHKVLQEALKLLSVSYGGEAIFRKIYDHLLFDLETEFMQVEVVNPRSEYTCNESVLFWLANKGHYHALDYVVEHFIHPVHGYSDRADYLNELDVICKGLDESFGYGGRTLRSEPFLLLMEKIVRSLVQKGVELDRRLPDDRSSLTWASLCKHIPADRLMDLFTEHKIDIFELSVTRLKVRRSFHTIWARHSGPFLKAWKQRAQNEQKEMKKDGNKRKLSDVIVLL